MFEVFFLSLIWRCCPSAKWCCPSGKSIEFFFSHSNFVLRSRKKTQWTFLQDNIILLQDNIFILRSWKKTSNISSSGQKRVWLSFETTSFCRRRKKIDKKILHPSVSQSSHDLLGNKSPLSHFSSVHHISSRTPFHFPRTLSFKITMVSSRVDFSYCPYAIPYQHPRESTIHSESKRKF